MVAKYNSEGCRASAIAIGRSAVTLLELLIVIAIIGLLIQLMIPAVQASRESARRAHCMNNIKQINLACLAHESVHKHLPAGGWGFSYTGDPDRGYGPEQPGGWIYNILVHVEQEDVRNIGAGLTGYQPGGAKYKTLGLLRATPVPLFYCPSRRAAKDFPILKQSSNAAWAMHGGKTDYAGNGGSIPLSNFGPELTCFDTYPECKWNSNAESPEQINAFDGLFADRSTVQLQMIIDGMSKTILVGEKYVYPKFYETGEDSGDDDSMYSGNDLDVTRWVRSDGDQEPMAPMCDGELSAESPMNGLLFGSAHSSSVQISFCDGRVESVAYSIDPKVFVAMGTREGGEVKSNIGR